MTCGCVWQKKAKFLFLTTICESCFSFRIKKAIKKKKIVLYLGEFLLNPCGQGCPCQRLTFLQCSGRERLSIRQDRLGQCLQRRIYTEEKAKVICASYFAPGRLEE